MKTGLGVTYGYSFSAYTADKIAPCLLAVSAIHNDLLPNIMTNSSFFTILPILKLLFRTEWIFFVLLSFFR